MHRTAAAGVEIRRDLPLERIDAAQWDALAGGQPFVSHAFLQALHDTGCASRATGWTPRYLTAWEDGALAGALAELSELPNSLVKRQLGIEPGATARGLLGILFFLWDQLDVLLGFWLVFALVVPPTPLRVAASVVVVVGIHPLLTVAGYLLGMRPTAR